MVTDTPVGVIDIGSNSVRLVIYDGLKHNPVNLFNEKVLCGLALGMDKTGCLNPEGVKEAIAAIGRYIKICEYSLSIRPFAFATSAVRDAKDGESFIAMIKQNFDVDVAILSGQDEARFASLGVMASIPDAEGVVGDLGGGSLELIAIPSFDKPKYTESYPIGPLRIMSDELNHHDYIKIIDSYIKKYPFAKTLKNKNFYAVGGGFRNIAKVHMDRTKYPLPVIQNYQVDATKFLSTLDIVSRMKKKALTKMGGISSKRLDLLPYTAILLERIIEIGKPKNIIFSVNGVREGILFSWISEEDKKNDPLLAGCIDLAMRSNTSVEYGKGLFMWIKPVLKKFKYNPRLLLAACLLNDIARYENPSYRAEIAYRKILDSSLVGVNHKERVMIAKSLYYRYEAKLTDDIAKTIDAVLSKEDQKLARVIGFAMRLARSLSANNVGILESCPIAVNGSDVKIKYSNDLKILEGEVIIKRLDLLKKELFC